MRIAKVFIGMIVNNLTVVSKVGRNKNGKTIWECNCICGNIKFAISPTLIRKEIIGCGCHRKYKGLSNKHKGIYKVWRDMIRRCYDKKSVAYKNYGGRGITVCEAWKNSFLIFLEWAIDKWDPKLNLDREKNSGIYEPSNCRFVTPLVNASNTRKNVRITYKGQTNILSEWGRIYNLTPGAIRYRIRNNWPLDYVFNTPQCRNNKKLSKQFRHNNH